MKMKSLIILCVALMGWMPLLKAGDPGPKTKLTVAFYNLENLYDTKDDPNTNDAEFLPTGANQWDEAKKAIKLDNMAKAIEQLGDEDGPELLGVCEVENRMILEELAANKLLKKKGYAVAHADSPDERGIDCALLYKKKRFLPLYQLSYRIPLPDAEDKTRDVFLVKGVVDGKHDLTVIVNHWPSRRGGAEESAVAREAAAKVVRHVVDSIQALDPYASVIIMGDLNDDPIDNSVHKVLHAAKDSVEALSTMLYNCMYKLYADGNGTLKYKGKWNLFDQIIVSTAMLQPKSLLRYSSCSAGIHNPSWMRVPTEGDWKDAPKRTYIGKEFKSDGFSDHFPVYIQLEY